MTTLTLISHISPINGDSDMVMVCFCVEHLLWVQRGHMKIRKMNNRETIGRRVIILLEFEYSIRQNRSLMLYPLENLYTDSSKITVEGTGFDATVSSSNTFDFKVIDNDGLSVGDTVKGLTKQSTMTRLVMSFTHLAPTNQNLNSSSSELRATVTVYSTWSTASEVTQANIVAKSPSNIICLEDNESSLNTDAAKITIEGFGFDTTKTSHNILEFYVLGLSIRQCLGNKLLVQGGIDWVKSSNRLTRNLFLRSGDSVQHTRVRTTETRR